MTSLGSTAEIAAAFVAARRSGKALAGFPGVIPADLALSYACQDVAIGLWGDAIAGWKVGGVAPSLRERFGTSRVVGPIFRRSIRPVQPGAATDFPVFAGGFAAVEAEFTLVLARDVAPDRSVWTIEEAASLVGEIRLGIETAGSPLATINDLGPAVIAADFGNNAGLILGPALSAAQADCFAEADCVTLIDGCEVGSGKALSLPGGPFESLRCLLENCARRGLPLAAGTLVATGATTGVHQISAGQTARVIFGDYGVIDCRAVPFGGG